ncbi:MAG: hypothetical protein RLZ04_1824 [Actinomycetota bacterium]|jgi:DNA-directed RNA polymerase specialized sigma24 family protein
MAHPPDDFAGFYLESKNRCFRALLATVGNVDEADELLAEAYTRAFANWFSVATHPAPAAWVVRTALNLHRDRWRRRERLAPLSVERPSAHSSLVDPGIIASICRLPTRQREVLVYRVLLDLSAGETARELGIDPGTVGTHLRRALGALRADLRPSEVLTTTKEPEYER